MPKFSVKKPFTVLVGVIIAVVIGIVSLFKMPLDLLPEINLPYLLVITTYPGASPEKVEEDALKTLGTEDKYAEVSVAQNLMTDETGEDFDYYARIAYVTEIQSATVDVLIMPKELYEHEKDSGMYADLRETFGDEVFESLGAVDDQHLELDGSSSVAEEFGLRYDPVCICLPGNVKNKENALKWIQSVLK